MDTAADPPAVELSELLETLGGLTDHARSLASRYKDVARRTFGPPATDEAPPTKEKREPVYFIERAQDRLNDLNEYLDRVAEVYSRFEGALGDICIEPEAAGSKYVPPDRRVA